jgi:hypothetical protein
MMLGYGSPMEYVIFDFHQEYCDPAMVSGCEAVCEIVRGHPARFLLPKSELSAASFDAFDLGAGKRFEIKRTALSDIINLRRFRKSKARDEAGRQAATNRALSGRTRAERERDERERKQVRDAVDQHRIEDENR